ncbi:hypothetical protein ACFV4M_42550, partial [Kitasatospora indigofera]
DPPAPAERRAAPVSANTTTSTPVSGPPSGAGAAGAAAPTRAPAPAPVVQLLADRPLSPLLKGEHAPGAGTVSAGPAVVPLRWVRPRAASDTAQTAPRHGDPVPDAAAAVQRSRSGGNPPPGGPPTPEGRGPSAPRPAPATGPALSAAVSARGGRPDRTGGFSRFVQRRTGAGTTGTTRTTSTTSTTRTGGSPGRDTGAPGAGEATPPGRSATAASAPAQAGGPAPGAGPGRRRPLPASNSTSASASANGTNSGTGVSTIAGGPGGGRRFVQRLLRTADGRPERGSGPAGGPGNPSHTPPSAGGTSPALATPLVHGAPPVHGMPAVQRAHGPAAEGPGPAAVPGPPAGATAATTTAAVPLVQPAAGARTHRASAPPTPRPTVQRSAVTPTTPPAVPVGARPPGGAMAGAGHPCPRTAAPHGGGGGRGAARADAA